MSDDISKDAALTERVPYRPSNASGGEWFVSRFCGHCKHDIMDADYDTADGCEILGWTFAVGVDDPKYPQEWREDGPEGPRCTAFERRQA